MNTEQLNNFLSDCIKRIDGIPKQRKDLLDVLVEYISNRINESTVSLTFICTHNSRRSHLSQVWAKIAADYYGYGNVKTFSGGTEVTAVYPSVLKTLETKGVSNEVREQLFSKRFDDKSNPSSNFAAVMTCTDADENCPFIPNSTRISLPYDDPKVYDGTNEEELKYLERSTQIATELLYVFSNVKK